MLAEATGVTKIVIACGRTDLRKGIDGLAQLVGTKYNMNPFEKNVLFLFCGGRGDRIKGLLWEGNGFSTGILQRLQRCHCDRRPEPVSSG